MAQKITSFIVAVIIIAIGYFWIVVDEKRTIRMEELSISDTGLKGDVNKTTEVYDRLELRWIGTSKHVKTLQDETQAHYDTYATKMDSINDVLEEIKVSIEFLKDDLSRDIRKLDDKIIELNEDYDAFKFKALKDIKFNKRNIESNTKLLESIDTLLIDKKIKKIEQTK